MYPSSVHYAEHLALIGCQHAYCVFKWKLHNGATQTHTETCVRACYTYFVYQCMFVRLVHRMDFSCNHDDKRCSMWVLIVLSHRLIVMYAKRYRQPQHSPHLSNPYKEMSPTDVWEERSTPKSSNIWWSTNQQNQNDLYKLLPESNLVQAAMMQPIWRFVCRADGSVQMWESLFSVMFHDVYKTVSYTHIQTPTRWMDEVLRDGGVRKTEQHLSGKRLNNRAVIAAISSTNFVEMHIQ